MLGPNVAWYLVVAALLFATGSVGVLLRRSPLIVLLSLELMLNAANLALIALSRLHGNGDGQIFALAVMAVAASEVVVGLGLIVAMSRKKHRARRRQALEAPPMTAIGVGAWLCLLAPLAGALAHHARREPPAAAARPGSSRRPRPRSPSSGRSSASSAPARLRTARSTPRTAWTWLSPGLGFKVRFSLLIDPLSVLMMLIVSGVGSLIVAYSIGYMHGENEERRYFAYMALFVFSMLLLVMGGNLLLLLAGWGMVGLSCYLLIGFYQERPSAIAAAKKAFVMNAFGDATIALALFLMIWKCRALRSTSSSTARPGRHRANTWVANLVALGLLGGALAKSAQLPLQTWLPDAMEGPTPVSALIHAATMVTAGVYLIARTHVLF